MEDVIRAAAAARRRHRRAEAVSIDRAIDIYTALVAGGIVFLFARDSLGNVLPQVDAATVSWRWPAGVGLVLAALLWSAARLGQRGGPLLLDPADVRHLLLAPIDRAVALRRPAVAGLLRSTALWGATAAVVALTVPRSVARFDVASVAGLIAVAMWAGATSYAAALAAGGLPPLRLPLLAVAAVLAAWSAAGLADPAITAPTRWLAELAFADRISPVRVAVAAAVFAASAIAAATRLRHVSVEAAERRGSLFAAMRFSAARQDLRTFLVLRRVALDARPRSTPWLRVSTTGGARLVAWRRGWHGLLRWPAPRIGRVTMLAAFAAAAASAGYIAALAAAGVALFAVAVELVDPVMQEDDHPDARDMHPVDRRRLIARLLSAPVAALAVITLASIGPFGLAAVPPTVLGATAAAMWAFNRPPPDPFAPRYAIQPEVLGSAMLLHYLVPVALSAAGLTPLAVGPVAALPLSVGLGAALAFIVQRTWKT